MKCRLKLRIDTDTDITELTASVYVSVVDWVSHYRLPMDTVDVDGYIANPSSLHAMLRGPGAPPAANDTGHRSVSGVEGQAVRLGGATNCHVVIDTTALKSECFGDPDNCNTGQYTVHTIYIVGSVAEWLACWTQAQKGPGSNRSRDAVG